MNKNKQRKKNQRKAKKLGQQAWQSAEEGNYDLALKIAKRAVNLSLGNPVLWNDQGCFALVVNDVALARESFQSAIAVAPTFAEPFYQLSKLELSAGNYQEAYSLACRAVQLAADSEVLQQHLNATKALLGEADDADQAAVIPVTTKSLCDHQTQQSELSDRVSGRAWSQVGSELTKNGYCHLPEFVSPEMCQQLVSMFDRKELFARTVEMKKERFGQGVYRYFRAPLPNLIDALRQLTYPMVAKIANDWQRELGKPETYPPEWTQFQQICAQAGQTYPTPLLLRYESGGFNDLHQDIRGEVFFPIQLLIVLSPRVSDQSQIQDGIGFVGGEFIVCDQPEQETNDRKFIPASLGDAVLFCTRSRLKRVGSSYGLRSVKHGMDRIHAGTRYALGIPFHDYQ